MPRKLQRGLKDSESADLAGHVALERLLTYAAREAAEQNRYTTAKLIRAAIASLPEGAVPEQSRKRAALGQGYLSPAGRC